MIPKKIHYIWLGNKPKSRLTELCINSWRRTLKDYEIIEWNENNLKLEDLCENNLFLKKCYDLKLWAFMSDYLRLLILYEHGGIYLDTDVEVLKSYDPLLFNEMFLGYELEDYIGTGVIGAEKNNRTIKRLLDFYTNEIWDVDFINNPIIFSYLNNKEPKCFINCKIYPRDYFSPLDYKNVINHLVDKKDTYSIHWYSNNWNLSRRGKVFIRTKNIKSPLKKILIIIKINLGILKNSILQKK